MLTPVLYSMHPRGIESSLYTWVMQEGVLLLCMLPSLDLVLGLPSPPHPIYKDRFPSPLAPIFEHQSFFVFDSSI
jgi:hypothetical protein